MDRRALQRRALLTLGPALLVISGAAVLGFARVNDLNAAALGVVAGPAAVGAALTVAGVFGPNAAAREREGRTDPEWREDRDVGPDVAREGGPDVAREGGPDASADVADTEAYARPRQRV